MKTRLALAIALSAAIGSTDDCMALTGKWHGDLDLGSARLPLIFSFRENPDGKTLATMDSPRQNAKDIPLTVTACTSDSLSVECGMIGASYSGRISNGKITGTFRQNGISLPLTLEPEQDPLANRPQTPQPPFPYIEKDTVFHSCDGTELAATLTIPENADPSATPVVVMVTGSGPQNRDEELFGHRPFAVIADRLARNGIASLRYDDRGVASSKGNFQDATIDTFKADAESALGFAKSLPGFSSYGLLGHSEGGTIAAMIAAEANPDFVISLAGASVPARTILISQNTRQLDRLAVSDTQKAESLRLIAILFDMIRDQYAAGESSPLDIDSICTRHSLDVPPVVLASIKQNMLSRNGYFDSLVSLDPTGSLRRIECPVLAVNGTKDTQVECDANLEAFRINVRNVTTKRMDGLNHLMQHAVTGDASEYGDIRETVSPEVLAIIVGFIKDL